MRPERPKALVTGGNRGIGLAIAQGLLAAGMDVVIGVRDAAAGDEAAIRLGCGSAQVDLAAVARDGGLADALLAQIGPVDVLVNNAGVLIETNMIDDPAGFYASVDVMFRAPYELIRAVVPGMRARRWGRIVNVSSDWGSFSEGLNGPGAYGVAKAALNALTYALPRDLPSGVKINAMCPGWVRTRMGGAGATRSPEEGADTALWLADLPADGPSGGYFRDRQPLAW